MCKAKHMQELMPGFGSEDRKHDSEKSKAGTAAVKSWLANLTKKKRDGASEDGSSANAELSAVLLHLFPLSPFLASVLFHFPYLLFLQPHCHFCKVRAP